jgi:hypothetical protein
LAERKGGLLFLTFLLLEFFGFAVAVACAVPTKARLSNLSMGIGPTSHVFDPAFAGP